MQPAQESTAGDLFKDARESFRNVIKEAFVNNGNASPADLAMRAERVCFNKAIEIAQATKVITSASSPAFYDIYNSQKEKLAEIMEDSSVLDNITIDNVYELIKLNLNALNELSLPTQLQFPATPAAVISATPTIGIPATPNSRASDHPFRVGFRTEVLKVFEQQGLAGMDEFTVQLERACYNAAISKAYSDDITPSWNSDGFVSRYNYITYNLLINLDPTSSVGSSHLIDLVRDKKITAGDIVNMPAHEMAPANSASIRSYIAMQLQQKIEEKTSSLYYCTKCGERKTTYTEKQTRSSDEPTTIFIKCVNCGHRWIC